VVKQVGAAGFTIGTAALDGKYPATSSTVTDQLSAIIRDVARLNNHLSPFSKKNIAASFVRMSGPGSAVVSGQINDMQIKLARFEGPSAWHFKLHDDTLIFVHKGKLLMQFRDREETVEEGEFIVIPHGVEHRPAVIEGICEAIVIEPGTPL
jgi:mannose-6-phosphate isomerase-like protein (cupin superfamily)